MALRPELPTEKGSVPKGVIASLTILGFGVTATIETWVCVAVERTFLRIVKIMEGLVKEGSEAIEEDFEDAVMDAALIGAAQRVEHYEIAAYGTVCEFAKVLGEREHATLLEQTLEEEKETDEKLSGLAKDINAQANEDVSEEQTNVSNPRRKAPRRVA